MEPSGPTSGIPPLPARPVGQSAPPPLQVGQLLQATVLENREGKLLLALGHRQLLAESSLPFRAGEVLTLEVRSLGEQPVMRVLAALQESAVASAVRLLLPRYGATTPLLASLPRLVQTPTGSLPPALPDAVRALLRHLPDRTALTTAQGVRTAIERSGSFLEHTLATRPDAAQTPLPAALDSDFKANLLRLLVLLRQPPAGNGEPADTDRRGARPPAPRAEAPPPAAVTQRTTVVTTGRAPAGDSPPGAAAAKEPGGSPPVTREQPASAAVQNLKNVPPAPGAALPRRAVVPPAPAALPAATGGQPSTPAAMNPPPPFAGIVPTAQPPARLSLDLLNSLGHLRADLLMQTEAALARIHLNQLASLPREGEHRLVEWLFDIPVRRGEDIDLWSARLFRDAGDRHANADQPQPMWNVQLAFDLPGLGPVQAHINLRGETVSTRFRAELPETLPLLQAHLHELRHAMQAAGLDVDVIDCQAGNLPVESPPDRGPLIDEQA